MSQLSDIEEEGPDFGTPTPMFASTPLGPANATAQVTQETVNNGGFMLNSDPERDGFVRDTMENISRDLARDNFTVQSSKILGELEASTLFTQLRQSLDNTLDLQAKLQNSIQHNDMLQQQLYNSTQHNIIVYAA